MGVGSRGWGEAYQKDDERKCWEIHMVRIWHQAYIHRRAVAAAMLCYMIFALLFAVSLGFTGEELFRTPPWIPQDPGLVADFRSEFVRVCGTDPAINFSKYYFQQAECVWQPSHQVCPNAPGRPEASLCIPIEPLEEEEWRNNPARVQKGDALEILDHWITYKANIISLASFQRLVYIDLGTKRYDSSIGNWFRARYPQGDRFKVIGFEPETKYDDGYVGKDVELHHLLAWTANTSVMFTGWFSIDDWFGRWVRGLYTATESKAAIDVADFLRQRVSEDDYVVLKMDIEGTEYRLIPHLLQQGVTNLLDEVMVEPHTNINSCCKHRLDRFRSAALRLIRNLREAGVYAHEWG
mmetsp:Transcript_14878/g.33891  ORF Transcript_14878/g.33891 Transcript_14878/m.33891 type:complete len:352 (-) Transcript_14878:31-1086(-)